MSSQLNELRRSEKEAQVLIKKHNIKEAPVSVIDIVKSLGINVIPYGLGDGVSGILVVENNKSTIGYSTSDSKVRQRFTIAHELGHFILHHNANQSEQLFVDKDFLVKYRGLQKYSQNEIFHEQQANAFAAELLMPKSLIEAELTKKDYVDYTESELIEELAKVFDVSLIAMSYRLANLNIYI
jgi:Zn-dependent peptidase ImmA (M78 family)